MSKSESNSSYMTSFEEIEIRINDIDTTHSEEVMRETLKRLKGVRAARIVRGGVTISYNPSLTVDQIRDEIVRAGFTIDGIETGRKSPERRGAEDTGKEIWRA